MVAFRLRVGRPFTASSEDLDGRRFLHLRRAQLLRALVDAFGLNVRSWGDTLGDYPREEVALELDADSDEVLEEVIDQLAQWVRSGQIRDAYVTIGNKPEVSVRVAGNPTRARRGAGVGIATEPAARKPGEFIAGDREHPTMAAPPDVDAVGRPIHHGYVMGGLPPPPPPPPIVNIVEDVAAALPGDDAIPIAEPVAANGDGGGAMAEPPDHEPVAANGDGGGAAVAAPELPVAAGEDAARDARPTAPRYTNVLVYETADTDDLEKTRVLTSEEPLRLAQWYELDVAIELKAGGIKAEGAPREIEPVPQEANVEIAVLASSSEFEIDEPVRTLTLPPTGPSTGPAAFKIRPTAVRADATGEIRIQLLYKLNLIEDVVLVASLVAKGAAAPADAKLRIRYAPIQEFTGLNTLPPKQMHLHVSRRDQQYLFYFVIEVEEHRLVFNGRAPSRLGEGELAALLTASRNALLKIALTHISREDADPPGSRETDPDAARELAEAGRKLWKALFGNLDESLHDIGTWLEGRHFEQGALIQVTVDDSAGTFVFPWGLLYDRRAPKGVVEQVDTEAFWGLRYVIEQHVPPIRHQEKTDVDFRPSLKTTIDAHHPLNSAVMLGTFVEARAQQAFFESLSKSGVAALDDGHVTRDPDEGVGWIKKGDSDIYSFFTHGHTAKPLSEARTGVSIDDFLKLVASLPKDSIDPAWRAVQQKIEDQKLDDDETWIELAGGRIDLSDLDEIDHKFGRPAVVLLNMCESVQLTPTLAEGLVDKFMQFDAMAIVGTETSVPPRFAHHFGLEVLTSFLGGSPLGPLCSTRAVITPRSATCSDSPTRFMARAESRLTHRSTRPL